MPITGTPVQEPTLTSDKLRRFLRDYTNNNILLDDIEFSNLDILDAIDYTVAKYNAFVPVTTLVEGNINSYVLLIGVTSHLLKSEALKQMRNQLSHRDGDISLGIDDKAPLYMNVATQLGNEFIMLAKDIKKQSNMQSAFGSMASGYGGRLYN